MTDRHTHTHTDASDLIICPMLCYSNKTRCRAVTMMNWWYSERV